MEKSILNIRNSKKIKFLGYFVALIFIFNVNLSYALNKNCLKHDAVYSMISSVEKSSCPSHAKNNSDNQIHEETIKCQDCGECSNINQISLIISDFEYLAKAKSNAHNVLIKKLLSQKNRPEGPPPKLFS